jgi:RND family efflux transporter MFP subunit
MVVEFGGSFVVRLAFVSAFGFLLLWLAPANAQLTELSAGSDATSCLVRPKQVIELGTPVAGLLTQLLVDRGDTVKAGQLIAQLDSRVEEAQLGLDRYRAKNTTEIEAARTDLDWNQRELERKKKLRDNMFAKIGDVDEYETKVAQDQISIRKAEMDAGIAALEAERSQQQLDLKRIKSPVDGVVTERKLAPGEYVYEQTPLMTIAELDPLYVELVMPASRYGSVMAGMTAELRLNDPVGGTYSAKVQVVDPIIDAASNTFGVRLVLPNPGNKIPAGIRCSVRLAEKPPGAG